MSAYMRRLAREDSPLVDLGADGVEVDLSSVKDLVGIHVEVLRRIGEEELHLLTCTVAPDGAERLVVPLGNLSEHLDACCEDDLPAEAYDAHVLASVVLALRSEHALLRTHIERLTNQVRSIINHNGFGDLENPLSDALEELNRRYLVWLAEEGPTVLLRAAAKAITPSSGTGLILWIMLETTTEARAEAEAALARSMAELDTVEGQLLVVLEPGDALVRPMPSTDDSVVNEVLEACCIGPGVLVLPRKYAAVLEQFQTEVTTADVTEESAAVVETACTLLVGSATMTLGQALTLARELA